EAPSSPRRAENDGRVRAVPTAISVWRTRDEFAWVSRSAAWLTELGSDFEEGCAAQTRRTGKRRRGVRCCWARAHWPEPVVVEQSPIGYRARVTAAVGAVVSMLVVAASEHAGDAHEAGTAHDARIAAGRVPLPLSAAATPPIWPEPNQAVLSGP